LATLHIHSYRQSWTQEEAQQSRKFVLDLMPRVLFANGPAVSGLISSSVSSYVEFMTIQGLCLVTDTTLQAVPSSKSQVFQSTLLSPIEKRKLMKLLQLVLEYGELTSSTGHNNQSTDVKATTTTTTTTKTNDTAATLATATSTNSAGSSIIDTINERNVQELGMSLRRPQNKPMNKSSLDQLLALAPTSSSSYYYSQPSLQDYLQSQFQIPTSSFLSQVILHALCLQHSTQQYLPVTKGIDTLVRHVSSLGKYVDTTSLTTSTAFIAPLYGTSELVQGFCRSCAVHGGVYMLRTTMESIRYGGSPSSNNGIMVSGTILTQGAQESNDKDTATHSTTVHFPISCKHVVVPQDAMLLPPDDDETGRANSTTTKILRRTCVIRGTLILPNQQQRSIAIIPPLTQGISNTDAIFILILDASLNLCPVGYTVLHLSTSLVTASSLDHDDEDEITNNSIQSLDKALEYLLNICSAPPSTAKTQLSSLTDHDSKSCTEEQVPSPSQSAPQEILQVTFSISANDDNWLKYGRGSTTGESNQQVRGLHVCKRPHLAITVDEAFEEAERIFHDIMNDTETDTVNPPNFLKMSNEVRQQVMKNVIGIRNEDIVDDDEKDILASAMDLIGSPNCVEYSNMDQQVDSNIIIPFD